MDILFLFTIRRLKRTTRLLAQKHGDIMDTKWQHKKPLYSLKVHPLNKWPKKRPHNVHIHSLRQCHFLFPNDFHFLSKFLPPPKSSCINKSPLPSTQTKPKVPTLLQIQSFSFLFFFIFFFLIFLNPFFNGIALCPRRNVTVPGSS